MFCRKCQYFGSGTDPISLPIFLLLFLLLFLFVAIIFNKSRAIAWRTARCRCKFRSESNFTTTSCGFSATARLSCIGLHQRRSNAEITHSTLTLIFTAVTRKFTATSRGPPCDSMPPLVWLLVSANTSTLHQCFVTLFTGCQSLRGYSSRLLL